MKNQCMGCQAGWPVHTARNYAGHLTSFHYVQGGYRHERVSCTADRYTETVDKPVIVSPEPSWRPSDG